MIWKRSYLDSGKKIRVLNWGAGDLESQNPKCQDLAKFPFSGGGGVLKPNSSLGVN